MDFSNIFNSIFDLGKSVVDMDLDDLSSAVNILTLGVGSAAIVAKYSAQKKAAEQQEAALKANLATQLDTLADQQEQSRQKEQAEMSERARRSEIDAARVRAIGADTIQGNTLDRLAAQHGYAASQDIATIQQNYASYLRQMDRQRKGQFDYYKNQMNQIQRPSILTSSLEGLGLGARYLGTRIKTQ